LVASFGYFIPKNIIGLSNKFVVIHPSKLPKYRGASPLQT